MGQKYDMKGHKRMHLFIVNPVAGKGRTLGIIPEIESLMKKHALPWRVEITNAPGHAAEIAREYIKDNRNLRIFAVGGDGTLNEARRAQSEPTPALESSRQEPEMIS